MKKQIILLLVSLFYYISSSQISNAQWEQIGPNCGVIRSIVILDNAIFAGTSENGIYRSTNNGDSWEEKNNGISDYNIYGIVVKDSNIFACAYGGGVYLSTNKGESWEEKNNGLPSLLTSTIAIYDSNIFVGDYGGGVFLSTDNGNNWIEKKTTTITIWNTVRSILNFDSNIFIGGYRANEFQLLHYSSDFGETWVTRNNGLLYSCSEVWNLVKSGQYIFACTDAGLYKTSNYGEDWLKNSNTSNLIVKSMTIVDSNIFLGTTNDGIYFSSDNGETWIEKNNGLSATNISTIAVKGKNIFAGSLEDGLFYSHDYADSWIEKNNGFNTLTVYEVSISNKKIFLGTDVGIFLSENLGNTWEKKSQGPCNSIAIKDSMVLAGMFSFGPYLSTDYGENWKLKINGITDAYNISCIIFKDTVLFLGRENVYRSTNFGDYWEELYVRNNYGVVSSIALEKDNIYIGFISLEKYIIGFYLSKDNGETWIRKSNGLNNASIRTIAVKDSDIYIGTESDGIFHSSNNGELWIAKNNGLNILDIQTICINGTNIFAGTNGGGIYFSNNNGETWKQRNNGLTKLNIKKLAVCENYIFAGTAGGGALRAKLSEITDVESEKTVNETFLIYPNPSSNILNLNFDNILSTDISQIKIYSGLGTEIDLPNPVVNGNTIQFDVSSLPQGVYYVCVFSEGKVERARFIKMDS
ncbi:MAG: T9SS type A sorting domain-containing protein [bacterium]